MSSKTATKSRRSRSSKSSGSSKKNRLTPLLKQQLSEEQRASQLQRNTHQSQTRKSGTRSQKPALVMFDNDTGGVIPDNFRLPRSSGNDNDASKLTNPPSILRSSQDDKSDKSNKSVDWKLSPEKDSKSELPQSSSGHQGLNEGGDSENASVAVSDPLLELSDDEGEDTSAPDPGTRTKPDHESHATQDDGTNQDSDATSAKTPSAKTPDDKVKATSLATGTVTPVSLTDRVKGALKTVGNRVGIIEDADSIAKRKREEEIRKKVEEQEAAQLLQQERQQASVKLQEQFNSIFNEPHQPIDQVPFTDFTFSSSYTPGAIDKVLASDDVRDHASDLNALRQDLNKSMGLKVTKHHPQPPVIGETNDDSIQLTMISSQEMKSSCVHPT